MNIYIFFQTTLREGEEREMGSTDQKTDRPTRQDPLAPLALPAPLLTLLLTASNLRMNTRNVYIYIYIYFRRERERKREGKGNSEGTCNMKAYENYFGFEWPRL